MAKTNGKYQCGSCEQFFDELQECSCPHCGSGNWVEGCIDDAETSIEEDKPVSMKPDKTLVEELRDLAEKASKQGYTNFTLPNTPVDTWGKDHYPENETWVKCDVGYILRFIADMME